VLLLSDYCVRIELPLCYHYILIVWSLWYYYAIIAWLLC